MVILIPAYEPDHRLVDLCAELRRAGEPVVVVDDGSGPRFAEIFAATGALGCTVLTHPTNRGKGRALKHGFGHIARLLPGEDVVTADCDGQHTVRDILRVGEAVQRDEGAIVLGSRRFAGRVPVRSRFGNAVTRVAFARSTGRSVHDTQTGLRGYPAEALAWLGNVDGERFEYELAVLLGAAAAGYELHEVPIDTRYLDGNASSHFRPIVDSLRVYVPLLRFSLSSLAAFALDFVLLFVIDALTASLLLSVVASRAISAVFNYTVNRTVVFAGGRTTRILSSAVRYFGLAAALLAANYTLMHVLHEVVGVGLLPAKLATEGALFTVSFVVQRRFVFASSHTHGRPSSGMEAGNNRHGSPAPARSR